MTTATTKSTNPADKLSSLLQWIEANKVNDSRKPSSLRAQLEVPTSANPEVNDFQNWIRGLQQARALFSAS
jgi:hypothetical protein